MTPEQARDRFQQLTPQRKPLAVSLLAHNLTIAARAAYADEAEEGRQARKLRALNELQHTVSAKLMALAGEDPGRFPDEGFLDVLFEKARGQGCEADLLAAFTWTFRACA